MANAVLRSRCVKASRTRANPGDPADQLTATTVQPERSLVASRAARERHPANARNEWRQLWTRPRCSRGVALLLMLAAGSAFAQRSDPEVVNRQKAAANRVPWRGSQVVYGHTVNTLAFNKGAEPYYNPTYSHRFELLPRWNFGDQVYLAGRFELSQELTLSEQTTHRNEIVASDVRLETGVRGWMEPRSKVIASTNLRLQLPTSKISQGQTMLFSLGPAVRLSREFPVRFGLFIRYDARFTQRFHRFTTSQYQGPTLPVCSNVRSLECDQTFHSGFRNVARDIVHGPSISWTVLENLELNTTFLFNHAWLYPLSTVPPSLADSQALGVGSDVSMLHRTAFMLGARWTAWRGLSLSLGTATLTPQPGISGQRLPPFFNRYTTVYFDLGVDFEGLMASN